MKALVYIKTLDAHKMSKCIWRGRISAIPAAGSTVITHQVGEEVDYTYYDLDKDYVEIHLAAWDVGNHYKEVKRPWRPLWVPLWWPVSVHANKKVWYKWLLPRRMTLKSNPRVHRWLWFVW